MRIERNTSTDSVEKNFISDFAVNPSATSNDRQFVGHLESTYDSDGKTVFEKSAKMKKCKWKLRSKPDDIEGFRRTGTVQD